jgi:hypothetical protein
MVKLKVLPLPYIPYKFRGANTASVAEMESLIPSISISPEPEHAFLIKGLVVPVDDVVDVVDVVDVLDVVVVVVEGFVSSSFLHETIAAKISPPKMRAGIVLFI